MSSARDVPNGSRPLTKTISNNVSLSTSPTATFHSPPNSYFGSFPTRSRTYSASGATKQLKPYATEDIKVLLLENVNDTGINILKRQGYQIEFLKSSLPEDELIAKIK
jgi:D-3-phosphoglycerate dehydrogenase